MRIGIDARPLHWPGIGRVIGQLLAHLGAEDRDNHYVVYHTPGDEGRLREDLGANFVLVAERAGVHTAWEQLALPRRIRADRLDVFHAPSSLVVPVFSPAKLVVTVHDVLLALRPDYLESRLGRMYLSLTHPLALRRAHTLVTVSDFTRAEVSRLHPALGPRMRTVHNGVSAIFAPGAPTAASRELLVRLGTGSRFVLYVGTLKRQKNVPALIEGFAALRPDLRQDVKLVLVSRPDDRYPHVPRLIERHRLAGAVIFVSGLEDRELVDLYRAAEVLAMPSTYEGFGLPVVEAMACATAIAASDIPVFREVAGDAAIYFDPADPRAIAASLERVLDDPEYRTDLARRGPVRAARFSWPRVAREMRTVYEEAARADDRRWT